MMLYLNIPIHQYIVLKWMLLEGLLLCTERRAEEKELIKRDELLRVRGFI